MDCLQKMVDGDDGFDWDSTTIRDAAGLLKRLEDEEFMVFLHFFHRVMLGHSVSNATEEGHKRRHGKRGLGWFYRGHQQNTA